MFSYSGYSDPHMLCVRVNVCALVCVHANVCVTDA